MTATVDGQHGQRPLKTATTVWAIAPTSRDDPFLERIDQPASETNVVTEQGRRRGDRARLETAFEAAGPAAANGRCHSQMAPRGPGGDLAGDQGGRPGGGR